MEPDIPHYIIVTKGPDWKGAVGQSGLLREAGLKKAQLWLLEDSFIRKTGRRQVII